MYLNSKAIWKVLILSVIFLNTIDGDGLRLPDQAPRDNNNHQNEQNIQQEQGQGRNLLDLVGLGTGPNVDPFVARTNANCLSGELSECFKTHAISTFEDFFTKDTYRLTDYVNVIRVPETQLRSIYEEPYEFSSESRSSDSEWDQLLKYGLRKLERFIKSSRFEIQIPEELTEGGRYSPRFIDDINDEIDIIEDKRAPLLTRHKIKKLFIPLLLVLKIFKLKLLLFLPFIFGLVSIKKFLALAAIVIPGIIGYFKLCRPQQNYNGYYSQNSFPQYSPQGVGPVSYYHDGFHSNPFNRPEPIFTKPYTDYYSKSNLDNSIRFGEKQHDLAYQGYAEYRNNKKETSQQN